MPYIYNDVQKLEGKPIVGNGNCVALVQALTDVLPSGHRHLADAA